MSVRLTRERSGVRAPLLPVILPVSCRNFGLVAYLGKRCVRNAETVGSNPIGSTFIKRKQKGNQTLYLITFLLLISYFMKPAASGLVLPHAA